MTAPTIYSVLNWGLGHATRSVPIIRELERRGMEVHLASSGDALLYLSAQFPHLRKLELPDYKVKYPTKSMYVNAILFAPTMWQAILQEQKLIRRYAEIHRIKIAFSDNRYGAHIPGGQNYFIGHQLNIKAGNTLSSGIANKIQSFLLRHFEAFLVPDFRQMPKLSGNLSESHKPLKTYFIGPLSSYKETTEELETYRWCCILSGVEPRRKQLALKLYDFLENNQIKSAIISGKPYPDMPSGNYVDVFPLLQASEVQGVVDKSSYLCMRSGYTSIMDLAVWRKPALLIPTPGQTEQIYLAQHLKEHFDLTVIEEESLKADVFLQEPKPTITLPKVEKGQLSAVLDKLLRN